MLFDPKWTNPKPWTLEHLILWLGSKDERDTYIYSSCENCLLAQYAKELGYKRVRMGQRQFNYLRFGFIPSHKPIPYDFNYIALYGIHSFKAAKERAIEVRNRNASRELEPLGHPVASSAS